MLVTAVSPVSWISSCSCVPSVILVPRDVSRLVAVLFVASRSVFVLVAVVFDVSRAVLVLPAAVLDASKFFLLVSAVEMVVSSCVLRDVPSAIVFASVVFASDTFLLISAIFSEVQFPISVLADVSFSII